MRVEILKSFPFSRDGITTLQAVAGGDEDIPERLVTGLQREGFVGDMADCKVISAEELPIEPEDRDNVSQRDRRRRGGK